MTMKPDNVMSEDTQLVADQAHGSVSRALESHETRDNLVTHDSDAYRGRYVVERCFNVFKHWRGLATRHNKLAVTYLCPRHTPSSAESRPDSMPSTNAW